jgi:hypothetical protein
VIQKRLRDAFVIKVSLFRELLWVAQDTVGWYGNNPMPTHCWLVRELDACEQFPEIMAEEITLIIMSGGVLTLIPNKDWAAECPDGIYLPIAMTAGIFTLPISRAQALRWLKNKDWGADVKVSVTAEIHVPGQSDVKKLKVRELGTHSSHFCKREWKDAGYMSVQMAGLDDQAFLNEPILRVFRHGSSSRAAQQLQVTRLTKEDLLFYAPDMVPKDPRDYYMNVFLAREIIENPEFCHDEGAKSIVEITENLPVGDYRMKEWNITQTVRAIGGRPVIQTPDEPLRATNVGWCAELAEAGANRPHDPDSIDDGSYGLKAKAARDMWFAVSKIATNILRHYCAHIPERGNKHDRGCYVDSRGWVLLDIILEWINGEAYELAASRMQTAFNRHKSAGGRREGHYTCALPTKSDRGLLRDPKIQAYVKNVTANAKWYRDIRRFEDKEDINDSNSFLMTDRLEDATPTAVVKRGGSIQPQALGSQRRSKVGSSAASSSQGQNKIFDPKTAPTIIGRPRHAASSSSVEAKKRPTRRGRGPQKAKGEAQTTPNAGPTDSPTTGTTRTRRTTPQRSSPSSQQQQGDAALIVSMLPCGDFGETERERQEEIARTQRNLASRTALDNALADIAMQAAGVEREQTPRERDLGRRRQILNRRSRQEGRREGPYSLIPRPYAPRSRRGRGNPASTRTTQPAPDADTRDPTDE